MTLVGLRHQAVEIEPGTTIKFWAPSETTKKVKEKAEENVLSSILRCLVPNKLVFEKVKVDPEEEEKKKKTKMPAVVLLHGFTCEGIMTWQLQVRPLTSKYAIYILDLLFFGHSITSRTDWSPEFQGECMVLLIKFSELFANNCAVVGFSYGGMVGFKMAELHPDMVKSLVVTGAVTAFTDSLNAKTIGRLGFSSPSDFLLPTSVEGVKTLLKAGIYMKPWLSDRVFKDYFQVMFNNRKERAELLETLISSSKDATIPNFTQVCKPTI
ncbi:putative aminoacrylate hydrolase RutD [Macadamia integrifolia]|uniref:putative aminoacrylate hydrolase RutD n=1 Tax=Macadamia integrifolia TaxID=60698 RepID=UPI001C4EF1BF|nr:putative aminoacrylate hydrolase RutD [Macadamia integrifolia]